MKADSNPKSTLVEYEMGYGADEFGKVLLGPFSGDRSDFDAAEIGRHHWRVSRAASAFELEIKAVEMPPRKPGLFRLPVLDVKFDFGSTETSLRDDFLHRFHQYFHKGGG